MTYSIVAFQPETGEFGVAVATRRTAVGARVPWLRSGCGAVASQAISNPWLAVAALDLLARGAPAEAALEAALALDPSPQDRQLHLVDGQGRTAAWTGSGAPDHKGNVRGANFSVAGNHLAAAEVIPRTAEAFVAASGELADRLLAALDAGDAAGGDARGRQSAALVVVRDEPFPSIDLRVDDDPLPLPKLRQILAQWRDERLTNPKPRSAFLKGLGP
jgi:uncharacterized Ntn-hydrolase superfamily protein